MRIALDLRRSAVFSDVRARVVGRRAPSKEQTRRTAGSVAMAPGMINRKGRQTKNREGRRRASGRLKKLQKREHGWKPTSEKFNSQLTRRNGAFTIPKKTKKKQKKIEQRKKLLAQAAGKAVVDAMETDEAVYNH